VGLTSSATLAAVVLLTIAAPVTCLVIWSRLGPRPWVRIGVRAMLLLTCQATAVLLVGLLINNEYGF
jgi:hypothetical protein